jgi:hypothetical protein
MEAMGAWMKRLHGKSFHVLVMVRLAAALLN